MKISVAMVKELRERTGSGMMECKKALVEFEGNIDLAIEQMRRSGLAKADKKSSRIAAEGVVTIRVSADNKTAVITDVNCETDFVAKGDDFINFAKIVTEALVVNEVTSPEQLHDMVLTGGDTVDHVRRQLVAKLGENITVRRFQKLTSSEGGTAAYLHGSRIGVIVELAKADAELGKDVAMHIAASKPLYVGESEVPAAMIEQEKAIFSAQAEESGKPSEIIQKMIGGRIRKYLAEITLNGQAFIKDDKQSVGKLVKSKANSVVKFVRFEVGDGIEKKEENFTDEVMAQIRATK